MAQLSPVMTETATGSGTRLGAWLDYLTTPATNSPTDMPTPETYVMIALLDDGGSARLGSARYFPMSQTYRLCEGALELPVAARGVDDVYVTDSGRYRILTPAQHVELKKQEATAAQAAAAVAIAPKPPVPMPTEHMAALSIHPPTPAPVGCGMHAQISTVIAIGPANVELAAARAEPLAAVARKNNNVVTHVVLGVATDADAVAALALPTPRIFLAGANELVALRDRNATGPIRKYLEEALLMATVSPSAKMDSSDPNEVLWLLPASPVPLDGTIAALIPQMRRTLTLWCMALNTQWKEWYERYNGTSEELNAEEEALLRAYSSFPVVQRHPPLAGLTRTAMGLIGTVEGAPMGLVDHTIEWRSDKQLAGVWPDPASRWATTGTPTRDGSAYWAVASWCFNTKAALRAPHPLLDHQLTFNDLEYDVDQVLVTLAMHMLPGGSQPYRTGMTKMKGVLGPVILAGRGGNEPMRMTRWTLGDAPAVTMLLPEGYVQEVLHEYNVAAGARVMLASQGFLVLQNSAMVDIAFRGLSKAELDSERSLFGTRLWIHGKAQATQAVALPQAPVHAMITYRTQLDANAKPTNLLVPGTRVAADAAAQIYFVVSTSEDLLCGLRVCWSNADGRPLLDADTFEGGAQVAYETVL